MISVIVPVYNEAHHIYQNLLTTHDELNRFCTDHEIILVDDGSSDATKDEAKRAASEVNNIKVVGYNKNGGKGNALRYGFKHSSKDLITFLDGDLDIPVQQIEPLLNAFNETGADVVIKSKRHPASVVNGFPLKRRFLSKSYTILVRSLFDLPVSDSQVGIKLYRRDVLEKIIPKLLVKRYASDVEQLVLSHKYGFNIAECPVHIDFNASGDRISVKDIFNIAWDTAAIYYRLNILKYYDDIPDKAAVSDNKNNFQKGEGLI